MNEMYDREWVYRIIQILLNTGDFVLAEKIMYSNQEELEEIGLDEFDLFNEAATQLNNELMIKVYGKILKD